jgi:hypothetical protein
MSAVGSATITAGRRSRPEPSPRVAALFTPAGLQRHQLCAPEGVDPGIVVALVAPRRDPLRLATPLSRSLALLHVTRSTPGTSGVSPASPVHPEHHSLFCSSPVIPCSYALPEHPGTGPGTTPDLAFRNHPSSLGQLATFLAGSAFALGQPADPTLLAVASTATPRLWSPAT